MKAWRLAKDKHDIFQTNEPWPLYRRKRKKKKVQEDPVPETGVSIFNQNRSEALRHTIRLLHPRLGEQKA